MAWGNLRKTRRFRPHEGGGAKPGIVSTRRLTGRQNPAKAVTFTAKLVVPSSSRVRPFFPPDLLSVHRYFACVWIAHALLQINRVMTEQT